MLNQRSLRNHKVATLVIIKAIANANEQTLCYCDETNTFYKYLVAGSGFTANDADVLITGNGGDTRWIGVSGQYINGASSLNNIVEDTSPQLGGELDAQTNSIGFTLQTATGTGSTTIDWRLGNKFKFTFGAFNETFTFTAPTKPCAVQLILVQDGVGSRTVTFPATIFWPGGLLPTLTSTASAVDVLSLLWDGTNYLASYGVDFKVPA